MAGRYLATELQDDNGDVIYPHTEADIVFTSDGTTVEENLGGDVTDAEIQEIFGDSDSQPEQGKKMSVKEKIKKTLKRYQTLLKMRILDTVEEVEANTDDGYLMGAKAGAALINDLGGCSFETKEDGAYVKYTLPGGADPVLKKLGSGGKCTFTITATQSGANERGENYYGRVNGKTSMGVVVDFENKTVSFNSHSQTGTLVYRHGKDSVDGPWSANVTGSQSISNVSWKE